MAKEKRGQMSLGGSCHGGRGEGFILINSHWNCSLQFLCLGALEVKGGCDGPT